MAIDNENLEMVRFWIASHSDPDLDPDTDHHDANHNQPDPDKHLGGVADKPDKHF